MKAPEWMTKEETEAYRKGYRDGVKAGALAGVVFIAGVCYILMLLSKLFLTTS